MSGITLTRKPVEGQREIYVYGPCKITLIECTSKMARLAIEADKKVRILLGEMKNQEPGGVSTEKAKKSGSPF